MIIIFFVDGNNFSNFLFFREFSLSRDSLIILVRGLAMTLTEAFSNIEQMLSFPILLFDFKLFIIFFVSISLTGVNWKLVSFVLFLDMI